MFMETTSANEKALFVIGGINVLESEELAMKACETFAESCRSLKMDYIFKASFDKANRSSIRSYRGPGIEEGLKILDKVKCEFNVQILTDVHEPGQVIPVSEICDVIQLPAFLARQTDLVAELAKCGKKIHIKKPQFMSPYQVRNLRDKFVEFGCTDIMVCERGACFGYDNLVVDILGIDVMKKSLPGIPITVDLTHSLQCRTEGSENSGGRRESFMTLARSVVAAKIAGVFIEAHTNPDKALCDGPSAVGLGSVRKILTQLKEIDATVKAQEEINVNE